MRSGRGRTYDALIARAALKADAATILTWNVRDFAPFGIPDSH